jgi:hypothetical protein
MISLCLRLAYPILLNFDGLYGQDPYAYFDYSRQLAHLFTQGVPLGKFYYPLGFPLLGMFGFPLLVVAICGAVTCILCGALAWEAATRLKFSTRAAWLAAISAWLILTVSPQNVQSGSVIMSDMPALCWALFAAYALLRYERGQRLGWLLLAAFAGALTAMTRFQYTLIAVPFGLYLLLIWRGVRLPHALAALVIGLLTYAPQLVMTARTPEIIGNNLVIWNAGNIGAQTFITGDGKHTYDEPNWQYYLLPVRSPYYVSGWLLPLALIGLLAASRSKIGWFLVLWSVSQYLFLAGIPVQNIRYPLIAFPPIAVLIGLGIAWIIENTNRLRIHPKFISPCLRAGCLVLLFIGVVQMLQTTDGLMYTFIDSKNRELAILDLLRANIPETDATIYALDMIPAIQHYLPYQTVQIYYETPDSIATKRGLHPAYALFNLYMMETQWRGRPVGRVYQTIMEWGGWQSLGEVTGYTLFRRESEQR